MQTKFSVKNKLFILFASVMIIAISGVGWFGFTSAKDSYIGSALSINKGETKALSNEIKGILGTIPDDVIYNSNFYALNKLLVWEDLKEKKKIEDWKSIYISALKDYILNKKLYYQVRILDLDGNEKLLLKYNEQTNQIVQTSENKLQNKSGRDYFQKAISLKEGEFYISKMNLNVEHGKIEKPFVPVVRYATPLVNDNGQTKGVIVLNFNANNILSEISAVKSKQGDKKIQNYYLLDEEGYYLFNENVSKRWGFQLGTEYSFNKDFKGVMEKFKDKDEVVFRENGKIFSMHKIYPHKAENKYRYWYLVTEQDEESALSSLNEFIVTFFTILLSILAIGLFLINQYISKLMNPLSKVTSQLNALSNGVIKKEDIDYEVQDEIGQIVYSSRKLVDAIETTISQSNAVANGDFKKDIELLSKNDELGLALRSMTLRLKEISSLAKKLSSGNYDVKIIAKSGEDELGMALIDMIEYLKNITSIAESISVGEIDLRYKAQGESDRLGNAILQMIEYLKTILNQANAITNEDFSHNIEAKSKNDELGLALTTMTDILKQNHNKNKDEIWFSEGVGEFSDKISGIEDIAKLSKHAITAASRYVEASSGVLYIYDKEANKLNLISSFAFSNREDLSNSYDLGEGVVGQVALEQEPILLKNVKDNSIQIKTGTTSSTPKEIYALPIIHENELFGVIEMMSFERFSELHKDYLLRVSNIFATTFHTAVQNNQIKTLLEDSRRAYEELQSQSEELQVTNEQMEEQSRKLEEQSSNLQKQNDELQLARIEIDKRAEELELSNKYKSEFLANMSHELRTPLNSVILLSSLLSKNQKHNLNSDDIQKAKVINESGNELLRLINDILDLSKIESGKMELIVDKIQSAELVSSYKEIFTHTATDKGIEFNVVDNYNNIFFNDKDRLGQVLRNLLSNSLKFTKQGSVTLKLERSNKSDLPLKISVIDTGIGIPKEKQDLIFKAFTQVDGSTSRQYGGTGLGLSISKELIHLMKGEIELSSQENVGSTFTIYLPDLSSDFTGKEIETSFIKSSDDVLNKKESPKQLKEQYLIVEDDEDFAKILKNAVEEHGAIGFIANSGKEALQLAKVHKLYGAIVDLGLPDMSGLDVIKELKENTLTKNIFVQVISGRDKDDKSFEELRIDGYLQKPVSSIQINTAIESLSLKGEGQNQKILIVEDDKLHLHAIKDYIKEEKNIDVLTASSIHEAKDILTDNYFDIVVVDLGLNDGDGSLLCKYINEKYTDTSVLIYTGKDLESSEVEYLNDISDEIIIKNPNSYERLKDEVKRFLKAPELTVNERFKPIVEDIKYDADISIVEGKKALVVDDDIKNIFVLSSALQGQNMDVATAKNGKEALEYLEKNDDIDIVLMDIMMPIMDGYEAMELIREDSKLKNLPIIAVTAKAMKKDREDAIKSGADDYITKPIDLDKLLAMIAIWLNK